VVLQLLQRVKLPVFQLRAEPELSGMILPRTDFSVDDIHAEGDSASIISRATDEILGNTSD
jgi:hypothetical protein